MGKIWQKKGGARLHPLVETYTVGNDYIIDMVLLPYDIQGSMAHGQMLAKIGLLTQTEKKKIFTKYREILRLHKVGKFTIKIQDEDCHTAIENYLLKHLGDVGKKIHTGRSRNDQVLTAVRLYTKDYLKDVREALKTFIATALRFAEKNEWVLMPGYTHTQRAMPSSVGHWAASFVEAALDDIRIIDSAINLNDQSPLGAAAGFGVPLNLRRRYTQKLMGFERLQLNTLYSQNSRGKIESYILSALTQVMLTMGRFANDLVWFTSQEFNFFSVPDNITTGSSIMPQKRNLDVMELVRANVAVVASYQLQVQEMYKNLLSGYNRDLQLSKEPLMRGMDITRTTIGVCELVVKGLQPNKKSLEAAFSKELQATHEVYKLVKKGMPFREAYREIKEHLDNLKQVNPEEQIKQNASVGGPGNLQLGEYRKALRKL